MTTSTVFLFSKFQTCITREGNETRHGAQLLAQLCREWRLIEVDATLEQLEPHRAHMLQLLVRAAYLTIPNLHPFVHAFCKSAMFAMCV